MENKGLFVWPKQIISCEIQAFFPLIVSFLQTEENQLFFFSSSTAYSRAVCSEVS